MMSHETLPNGVRAEEAHCTALEGSVAEIHLKDVRYESFQTTFMLAHLYNLTCEEVAFTNGAVHFSPETAEVALKGEATLRCHTGFTFANYDGVLHMDATIAPSTLQVVSEVDTNRETAGCVARTSAAGECYTAVRVTDMTLDPPQPVLDYLLSQLKSSIESQTERYLCGVAVPRFAELLMNKTLEPPTHNFPIVDPGSQSANASWPLYVAVDRIVSAVTTGDGMLRVGLKASSENPGTFHLTVGTKARGKDLVLALNINGDSSAGTTATLGTRLAGDGVSSALKVSLDKSYIFSLLYDIFRNENTSMSLNLVEPALHGFVRGFDGTLRLDQDTTLSADLTLPNVQCTDAATNTYQCHIPRQGGVKVSNVRLHTAQGGPGTDLSQIITNVVGPRLAPTMESMLDRVTAGWESAPSSGAEDRVYLPMVEAGIWRSTPPTSGVIVFALCAVALLAGVVRLTARRHAQQPVCWRRRRAASWAPADALPGTSGGAPADGAPMDGPSSQLSVDGWEPLSLRRVVWEDGLLTASIIACCACFAWSNTTTAASVAVGDGVILYSFSLVKTAEDLWGAGLHFLSVAVFLFSCIYPYFKLASILVFTVVLQRPEATLLRVIDYLGKFSFLDTFVLLIMVTGLSDGAVVRVDISASFYLFLIATVGSIAIGNYATTVWRRGTTLRSSGASPERDTHRPTSAETESLLHAQPLRENGDTGHDDTPHDGEDVGGTIVQKGLSFLRSVQWPVSVVSFLVTVLCTLPSWCVPCLRYRLGGLAPLVTQEARSVTLLDLARTNAACGDLLVFILLIAPCAYALFYPRFQFLSSWCAADVFLVACIAGLLQLNQFVQFIIGPSMEGIYTAHAALLWPLSLLCIASCLQWVLTCSFLAHMDLRVAFGSLLSRCQGNRPVDADAPQATTQVDASEGPSAAPQA